MSSAPKHVVIVGTGGREHALVQAVVRGPQPPRLHATPGSDAIATLCPVFPSEKNLQAWAQAIAGKKPDLVIVGPEAPLVDGLADELRALGIAVFGPSKHFAQLEGSKAYSKDWMRKNKIPTAKAQTCHTPQERLNYVRAWPWPKPLVIKADGLAGGKGVVITTELDEALQAVETLASHTSLVFEEFLVGEEVSLHALISDDSFVLCPPVQDHKRRFDQNRGPNTGGMGTVSPPRWWTSALEARVTREVVEPTVRAVLEEVRRTQQPYRGVLFIGAMVGADETSHVLEFNVRFGDPETQTLLHRFQGDLATLLHDVALGKNVSEVSSQFSTEAAATVVVVNQEYPDAIPAIPERMILSLNAETGQLPREASDAIVHASTRRHAAGWQAVGGRVLGVRGRGKTLDEALKQAYGRVTQVAFPGMDFRRDLGGSPLPSGRSR